MSRSCSSAQASRQIGQALGERLGDELALLAAARLAFGGEEGFEIGGEALVGVVGLRGAKQARGELLIVGAALRELGAPIRRPFAAAGARTFRA